MDPGAESFPSFRMSDLKPAGPFEGDGYDPAGTSHGGDHDPGPTSLFRTEGVVCLRQVLGMEWIARLRQATDRVRATVPWMTSTSGTLLPDSFLWTYDPDFEALVRESPIPALVARLLDARRVRLFYDQVMVKDQSRRARVAWHQDLAYWPLQGEKLCSVWLALDPADRENGGVEYVAGSHRWDRLHRPPSEAGETYWDSSPFPPLPDLDSRRGELPLRWWALEPGDCVVHHARTVHASHPNVDGRPRRAHVTRWMGEGVGFDPRPQTVEFPVQVRIARGAEPAIGLFPVLWPRKPEGEPGAAGDMPAGA